MSTATGSGCLSCSELWFRNHIDELHASRPGAVNRQRCHRGTCGTYVSPPCGTRGISDGCGRDFSSDSSGGPPEGRLFADRRTGPRWGQSGHGAGRENQNGAINDQLLGAEAKHEGAGQEPAADIARSTSGTRLRIAQPPGAPGGRDQPQGRSRKGNGRSSSGSVQKKPMSTPLGSQAARWCSKILKLWIGSPRPGVVARHNDVGRRRGSAA